MTSDQYVKLTGATKLSSTDRAYLIEFYSLKGGPDSSIISWFPSSVVYLERDGDGNEIPGGDVYVEEWFIEKKQEELQVYIDTGSKKGYPEKI